MLEETQGHRGTSTSQAAIATSSVGSRVAVGNSVLATVVFSGSPLPQYAFFFYPRAAQLSCRLLL
jgi:hypothetical protein